MSGSDPDLAPRANAEAGGPEVAGTMSDAQRAQCWLADWRADPRAFALGLSGRCGQPGEPARLENFEWLAREVGRHLAGLRRQVGTAESCTGGGIARALTEVAGSSAWVEGGFITYSNAAKSALLGVPPDLLRAHGAVSGPVVAAMARGALKALAVDCAVSVSGVAGPGGGSVEKPVGTVWLCWAGLSAELPLLTQRLWFPGDRAAVRAATVLVALTGLLAAGSRLPSDANSP